MMKFDIVTLFPEMFEGVFSSSILRIAQEKQLVEFTLTDLRDFTTDRHRSVDDRPFGGGAGMVMSVEPVVKAVRKLESEGVKPLRMITSPQGKRLNQKMVEQLATEERILIIAGRYEGYDERIRTILKPEEVSLGDYVLSGGELAAMVIADAVTRLLPGVLGADDGTEFESFSEELGRGLEYPQYTRPVEFEGHQVPEVLRCGDHKRIEQWRLAQSQIRTAKRRPDLIDG